MHVNQQAGGPFSGYRVLELCSTIAGPVCARLMADFGAEVIKVEPAEGDPARNFGGQLEGSSLYAASLFRNKKAISLNLKTQRGRELVRELARRSDVLVENFRPGTLERLGLGYDTLSDDNPGLVMVRISGYGQTGPYSHRPGYGAICEAVAGVRHLTGDPDRPPARVALPLTDYVSAVYGAFGAAMALLERVRTGTGQVVDVALYEGAFSMMEEAVVSYDKLGVIPSRQGSRLMNVAPNNLYATRDGYVLIAANNDALFRRLAQLIDDPALAHDARFATQLARGEHADALDDIVSAWTGERTGAEAQALLEQAGIPNSRVYTIQDIFEDQHFRARDMLVKLPHPRMGEVTVAGVVPRLSRTPGALHRAGPEKGQDTRAMLRELGLGSQEIDELQQQGAIFCAGD